MKRIVIAVAGGDATQEYKDIQIPPGTKPRDVLAQLKLTNFQINKPGGGVFGFNDDLYPAVTDGQKLFVSPADVEAGASVMRFV